MKTFIALFFIAFLIIPFSYAQDLNLELIATNFDKPVNIKHAGDDKLYVAEKAGYVKIINADGSVENTPFLDIDALVTNTGTEKGLLGLAFHPNYASNGYFYVNYISNATNTVISRFTRSTTNPLLADPNSELIILVFDQPYSNHNGGDMAFGSDGFLYSSSGDGGSGGDPDDNSQNTLNFLGNIIRIDVNSTTATENYIIPSDNPYVGDSNFREEIWAYGLRNPWKFSFDSLNGDLWIADVGGEEYEEINMVTATEAAVGLNFGWRCYEGDGPHNLDGCSDASTYTYPINGYNHIGDGLYKCSITGGYRYRGTEFPNFNGWYFFADFCSQEIGHLIYNETTETWTRTLETYSGNWSAFGEGNTGELYIADLTSGSIYKIKDPNALSINNDSLSHISIYPNPSKNVININFGLNNIENLTISIYDIQGKIIKSIARNNEAIQQINTSSLSSGIYLLKISSENGIDSTHKLVIN